MSNELFPQPRLKTFEGRILDRQDEDVEDQGLAFDMKTIESRLSRRKLFGLIGIGAGSAALAACAPNNPENGNGSASTTTNGAPSTTDGASATDLTETKTETAGPYPGDGSNGPDVLEKVGVERRDIRGSIGGGATASGVPMTLKMNTIDMVNSNAPMAGAAVYIWHCDGEAGIRCTHRGSRTRPTCAECRSRVTTARLSSPQLCRGVTRDVIRISTSRYSDLRMRFRMPPMPFSPPKSSSRRRCAMPSIKQTTKRSRGHRTPAPPWTPTMFSATAGRANCRVSVAALKAGTTWNSISPSTPRHRTPAAILPLTAVTAREAREGSLQKECPSRQTGNNPLVPRRLPRGDPLTPDRLGGQPPSAFADSHKQIDAAVERFSDSADPWIGMETV